MMRGSDPRSRRALAVAVLVLGLLLSCLNVARLLRGDRDANGIYALVVALLITVAGATTLLKISPSSSYGSDVERTVPSPWTALLVFGGFLAGGLYFAVQGFLRGGVNILLGIIAVFPLIFGVGGVVAVLRRWWSR